MGFTLASTPYLTSPIPTNCALLRREEKETKVTTKIELLAKVNALFDADPDAPPVVTLDEYFSENDDEESIAPNNWEFGRPSIKLIYQHLQDIAARADVQGVYVSLHDEWPESLDDDELWPAAENIHIITTVPQSEVETWLEALEIDGVSAGWPYGEHKLSPKPQADYTLYTIFWN